MKATNNKTFSSVLAVLSCTVDENGNLKGHNKAASQPTAGYTLLLLVVQGPEVKRAINLAPHCVAVPVLGMRMQVAPRWSRTATGLTMMVCRV